MHFLPAGTTCVLIFFSIVCDSVLADKCLYSVLGVGSGASQTQLDQAFHKQSLKHHSDDTQFRISSPGFDQVTRAYHILSNPILRKQYDQNSKNFQATQKTLPRGKGSDLDMEMDGLDMADDYEFGLGEDVDDSVNSKKVVNRVSAASFAYSHTTQKDGEEPVTTTVQGGYHTGQNCKTITEKIGDTISTHTSCTNSD